MEKLNELMSKACLASELGKKGITVDLQVLSLVRDEYWALEQRAEAAEAIVSEVTEVIGLLSRREWAEHCTKTETGKLLEELITDLHNEAAPATDLAGLVPEKASMADYYENVRSGAIDPEEAGITMWDACRAAILAELENHK